MTLPCLGSAQPLTAPRGRFWIERPVEPLGEIRPRGRFWIERPVPPLGELAGGSQIHIRAIDRNGSPLPGTRVTVQGILDGSWVSNGDGIVVIPLTDASGTPHTVQVALPEGIATRDVSTVSPISGQVELFQSIVEMPKPLILLGEGISLLAGILLVAGGLSAKSSRGSSIATGLGTSLVGLGSFSFTYRHLR